jgi:malonate transporter
LLTVLSITSSIFIIIAIGFVTVKRGLLQSSNTRALGVFVVDYALPALLFKALSQQPLAQIINVQLLTAYALGSLALMVVGILFRCVIQRKGMQEAAILTMGMTVSNSAFMGFPIAEQIIHETARSTLAVYVSVENLIMLPVLLSLAELNSHSKGNHFAILKGIGTRLITNPLILSISAGVLFSIIQLQLPVFLSRALEMLSGASAPVALFYIGCTLASLNLKGMKGDIISTVFGKLFLHPLAIYLMLCVVSFDNPVLIQAAVINASMPMFSIYPLIGHKYGYESFCTGAMVITTMLSFFTITSLLWVIQSGYLMRI